jgi:hypothetical protein
METKMHPAIAIVKATEKLWESDDLRARLRADLIVARLIQMGYLAGEFNATLQLSLAPRAKPTVADLEAILNSEEKTDVEVMPDGSVRATINPLDTRMEDGLTIGSVPWESFQVTDPRTRIIFRNVSRDFYQPEATEHLPRLQLEVNNKEWEETRPEYRGMYEHHVSGLKRVLRAEFVERWGQS